MKYTIRESLEVVFKSWKVLSPVAAFFALGVVLLSAPPFGGAYPRPEVMNDLISIEITHIGLSLVLGSLANFDIMRERKNQTGENEHDHPA